MNGSDISLDLSIEALKDYFTKSIVSKNKIDQVQQLVASNYNITVEELKSKRRVASIAVPRQIAMYIMKAKLGFNPHAKARYIIGSVRRYIEPMPMLRNSMRPVA